MLATIFDIKHFAVHDGDGIRTTVFFKGCPLACLWCHNPEGLCRTPQLAYMPHKCLACGGCAGLCTANTFADGLHTFLRENCTLCGDCAAACPGEAFRLYGRQVGLQELLDEVLEDKAFYDASGGGVTLSGGECLLQADFCAEFLRLCKEHGLHTAVDTCGAVPQKALEQVMPYTDVFLYDVKAADDAVHRRCTGQGSRLILENLLYLNACGKPVEIRIPYVPGCNDNQMDAIGALLAPLACVTGVRLLKYHRFAAEKYAALDLPLTLPDTLPAADDLRRAADVLRSYGLRLKE